MCRSFTNAEGAQVAALNGLDLEIRRGEFIALLGPSGCGKSTALNCIAGLQPLTRGGIWLDDTRIDVLPPERRGFGMVFQNYALFPHMSVLDNVGFGLKMRGVPKQETRRRAQQALELVQLVGHEGKLPGQLSGGQQQRVAIARAIVIEPPLVLMDEPLSNLDTKLRVEMRAEIRRIHTQLERATIYVTHTGRSAVDGRPHRRDEGGRRAAGRDAEGRLHAPAQPARRALHGLSQRAAVHARRDGRRLRERRDRWRARHGRADGRLRYEGRGRAAPDDIERADDAGDNTNAFDSTVETVEYGGRDSLIRAVTPFGPIWARVAGEFTEGEPLRLRVAPSRTLVYPGAPT